MNPIILDGQRVADALLAEIKDDISNFQARYGRAPGLAVILVGQDPASQSYVASKKKKCQELGITSFEYLFNAAISEKELLDCINTLNHTREVDGILVQMPLPNHINSHTIIEAIQSDKDVDGFHPVNVGKLLIGLPTLKSCTPYGIMEILNYYHLDPAGKHVVIVGRSNIVGKPLAAMLVQREAGADATVTICHSRTQNLSELTRQADILIAAIGKPYFITADMVKPGAVVIDVGMNRISDNTRPSGYRNVGDVDYTNVAHVAAAITPVPGGVGKMTIAMLMMNTLSAYKTHILQ